MARRRYQQGSLFLQGNRWYLRYREDVIEKGKLRRVRRKVFVGAKADYPTQRLARRVADAELAAVNNPTYRPRTVATFAEFAKRWEEKVLSQWKTEHPVCDSQLASKAPGAVFREYATEGYST